MPGDHPVEDIRNVLYRNARAVDRCDWDLVRSCFHEDAIDRHGTYNGPVDGLIEDMKARHATAESSMHYLVNMIIEVDWDIARSETYCLAFLRFNGTGGTVAGETLTIRCRYLDKLERRQDRIWRISERAVVWEGMESAIENFSPGPDYLTVARNTSDPLFTFLYSG